MLIEIHVRVPLITFSATYIVPFLTARSNKVAPLLFARAPCLYCLAVIVHQADGVALGANIDQVHPDTLRTTPTPKTFSTYFPNRLLLSVHCRKTPKPKSQMGEECVYRQP